MDLQSPRPATTIRRNPPRKAKQTSVNRDLNSTNSSNAGTAAGITPFPLVELLETKLPQIAISPDQKRPKSSEDLSNNIKVFLRIRPIECKGTRGSNIPRGDIKAPSSGKILKGIERKRSECLFVNSSSSVTLNAPPSAPDSKRTKSEIYDGFSHVFPPESLQEDVYDKVMKPLVKDFMDGHSSLLVGMGPTGSGKTHTMFGSLQQPGIVPIALRQIFCQKTVNENSQTSRTYYLSMFEIHSERGKGEKIFDLSPESTDNTHPHTSIFSVKEVKVTTIADADNIVTHGILKRSTAPTNANNQSSRSQCIVNVRRVVKNDTKDSSISNAILTIADLAGAERERKTGNQGARLLESNFINNTSMIFGLCLRSLLEHQKNPKKPVEKHFKNSLLTRYLQDYMEGKKRMTLILTVKAAVEDYMETSYILRQTSPYMKIKFNDLDENKNAPCRKRNGAVVRTERSKRRKIQNSEASLTDVNHVMMDAAPTSKISERDSTIEECIQKRCTVDLDVELQKCKRSEEVMRNFARAFWSMLKQCKHKLKETENEVRFLKDSLRVQNTYTTELEKVLELRNSCSCLHNLTVGECAKVLPFSDAIYMPPPISSNPSLSHDNDAFHDEYHTLMVAKISGETVVDQDAITPDTSLSNTKASGGMCKLSLPGHQGTVQQVEISDKTCSNLPSEEAKEVYHQCLDENSESCNIVAEREMLVGGLNHLVKDLLSTPSLTVAQEGERCISILPGNEDVSDMQEENKIENELQFLKASLREHNSQATELEKELKESRNSSSCLNNPHVEECDKAISFSHAICAPPISLNPDMSHDNDALPGEYDTLMSVETSGETEIDRDATTLDMSLFNAKTTGDMGKLSLPVHQGALQQEEVSREACSSFPLEEAKELNYQYSDENSKSCHNEILVEKMDAAVKNFSEVPNLTVELEGEGCFLFLPGNEENSAMQVLKEQLMVKVAVSENPQQITKSHATEVLRNEHEDPALRTLNSERPKRKLLPASQMLLKDLSGLVMDENAKEIKRKKAANVEGRSQNSNSLIRILKSNLPR